MVMCPIDNIPDPTVQRQAVNPLYSRVTWPLPSGRKDRRVGGYHSVGLDSGLFVHNGFRGQIPSKGVVQLRPQPEGLTVCLYVINVRP
jgi:hypothetical protein